MKHQRSFKSDRSIQKTGREAEEKKFSFSRSEDEKAQRWNVEAGKAGGMVRRMDEKRSFADCGDHEPKRSGTAP